jgi:hypothetical protein
MNLHSSLMVAIGSQKISKWIIYNLIAFHLQQAEQQDYANSASTHRKGRM